MAGPTVLFTDIVGFSKLATALQARLVTALNEPLLPFSASSFTPYARPQTWAWAGSVPASAPVVDSNK